ncbi:penicillin-binding protein 1A [Candidatus Thiosymbion oneisti]|uniref:penicillin-binding protein 1A n=1 Tax=Candidatus Thiosymbion oneisti TaxID=589554 RepID=UPI000A60F924|nr:penicillin-binding protein 1A [Candidatus Thiosymbion oneisti]
MEKDSGVELPSSEAPEFELPMKTAARQAAPRNPRRSLAYTVLGRLMRGVLVAMWRALVAVVAGVLNLTMVGGLVLAAFVAVTQADLPTPEMLKEMHLQEPLRVYAADGGLMAEYGIERRRPVPFNAIPPLMVKAFLATEDARFFEHQGVDLKSIARAAMSFARTGERTQGGSTITMQVARNFFLSREKTFQRKFAELLLSIRIERSFTKEEILELYLNKIFFGHRAYGVSAAAALYYGKQLDELNLAEMAMLAGLPKAPSVNNPISNPQRARERRNYILRRMRDLDYITHTEFQAAAERVDQARLHRKGVDLEAGYAAEMVRRHLVTRFGEAAYQQGYRVTTTIEPRLQRAAQDAVRKALRAYDRRHGYHGAEAKYEVADADDEQLDLLLEAVTRLPDLTAGIVVGASAKAAQVYVGGGKRITLRLGQVKWARPFRNENWRGRAPRRVTDAVAVGDLIRLRRNRQGTWGLSQAPSVSGALVALSPLDGAIQAVVGGYYFNDSEFNRAVDARRQPGSSFKPFVYAAALNQGYTPASLVRDEPIVVRYGRRRAWRPRNADHKILGRIRMRVALTQSRNLASVHLLKRVGVEEARNYIRRFGFTLEELPRGLSLALGTAEVSPLQMAGAYALFANGGFQVKPYFISRIENGDGEVVFAADPPRACLDCWARYRGSSAKTAALGRADGPPNSPLAERVLAPGLVYEMTSMMQDVIKRGTGRKALRLKRKDLAGKTGTTNEVRDSWFCGFQKDVVTVAWMGYDRFRPLGKRETGGQAGLGMWVDFMRKALKGKPQAILKPPRGMVKVRVSKASGRRVSSGGVGEWVRAEYAHALQGPKPVAYTGGGKASGKAGQKTRGKKGRRASSAKAKQRAPRVIDDLF